MIHDVPENVKVLDIWKTGPAFEIKIKKPWETIPEFECVVKKSMMPERELRLEDGKSNKIDYRRDSK